MDDKYIDDVFGKDGVLSKHFKGYEPRPGQVDMARAVDKSFRESRHLIVEGPTGIGKSLAYSVPAVYHSVGKSSRVAIVTANIALQEQLTTKDLPLLAEVLPIKFKFALIKGRNNFICLDKWQSEQIESTFKGRVRTLYRKVMKWGRETRIGDKSELEFEPPHHVWSCFSVSSDECKGKDCRSYNECHFEKAKKKAFSCDLSVTNYHMLFADLKVRIASNNTASVLPDYDFVICDEGHKAADIAREFFGFRVTEGSVRFAGGSLNRIRESELYETIQEHASKMFHDLGKVYKSKSYKTRFKYPTTKVSWQPLCSSLDEAFGKLRNASETAPTKDEKASIARAAISAARISSNIKEAMTMSDSNMVYFLDILSNGAPVLRGKPVSVAELLSNNLFAMTSSVIITSATLSVSGKFDHIKSDFGCLDSDDLVVESPFRFNNQALLIVPDNMPIPMNKQYPSAVAKTVVDAIRLAKGKTLCLFTSYKNLSLAYEAVIGAGLGYNILRQGEVPRTTLIQQFKEDTNSVLLGTESFWAGVDVPGKALSCVVIDRLPFPTPDDPVLDAITGRDRNWFMSYSVPRAIIAFKQGFGRLIRTLDDRGVVVILDQRIALKPYGKLFLNSLPDIPKSRKLVNIRKFLYEME